MNLMDLATLILLWKEGKGKEDVLLWCHLLPRLTHTSDSKTINNLSIDYSECPVQFNFASLIETKLFPSRGHNEL